MTSLKYLTAAGMVSLAALAVAMPAIADDAKSDGTPPDSAGGRYMFNKTVDGMVRLDTQTGAVALCSQRAVGWACVVAPEDRAMLENEIARLRAENGALKKDILAHGLPLPAGTGPVAAAEPPQNGITVPLPSDADLDRMTAFANKVWQRFKDMVERAQQQMFNKS